MTHMYWIEVCLTQLKFNMFWIFFISIFNTHLHTSVCLTWWAHQRTWLGDCWPVQGRWPAVYTDLLTGSWCECEHSQGALKPSESHSPGQGKWEKEGERRILQYLSSQKHFLFTFVFVFICWLVSGKWAHKDFVPKHSTDWKVSFDTWKYLDKIITESLILIDSSNIYNQIYGHFEQWYLKQSFFLKIMKIHPWEHSLWLFQAPPGNLIDRISRRSWGMASWDHNFWVSSQPSEKCSWLESAPPSLRLVNLPENRGSFSFQFENESVPKVKEYKYVGVLFMSELKIKQEVNCLHISINANTIPDCHGEEGVEVDWGFLQVWNELLLFWGGLVNKWG